MGARRTGLRMAAAAALLAAAGCTTQFRDHGYLPPAEAVAQVRPGVTTRAMVDETLGVPSTQALLNDDNYYYVESRVRHSGFREPQVVSREVLAISFNSAGTVTGVERFDLRDGQVVPLTRRVTESGGQGTGFFRRLLQSLGRFSAADFLS